MTASVTGCSTWMRPFSSRKKKALPSTTNSTVPALRYPMARPKATAASCRRARRPASTCGAGASSRTFWWRRWTSSRARRAPPRLRARPRGAAPRRGEDARPLAVERPVGECARGLALRGRQRLVELRGRASPRAYPRPPPPAAALTRSGNPTSSGSPSGGPALRRRERSASRRSCCRRAAVLPVAGRST